MLISGRDPAGVSVHTLWQAQEAKARLQQGHGPKLGEQIERCCELRPTMPLVTSTMLQYIQCGKQGEGGPPGGKFM
jgi:hypothetical protein